MTREETQRGIYQAVKALAAALPSADLQEEANAAEGLLDERTQDDAFRALKTWIYHQSHVPSSEEVDAIAALRDAIAARVLLEKQGGISYRDLEASPLGGFQIQVEMKYALATR